MALAHNLGGYTNKMAELKQDLEKALQELRKEEPRKFDQTVDLIINLQKFDVKKSNVNIFVSVL